MTRHMKRRLIASILGAAALVGCSGTGFQDISAPASGAYIKFFNFAVNGPGVNYYANTQKMTAISSTTGAESTIGTAYGAVGNAGFYSQITAGTYTLTGKIAATTDNGLAVSTTSTPLVDGKYYSYYSSGFYNTTAKTEDAFVVEDVLPAQDFNNAYVRFVNASSNAVAQTLYARNTVTGAEVPLGADVAYKAGGTFVAIPQAVYDLNTRPAGTSTNVVTRTGVSFLAGRVYTITLRGDATIASSSTATNRSFLDNTTNR